MVQNVKESLIFETGFFDGNFEVIFSRRILTVEKSIVFEKRPFEILKNVRDDIFSVRTCKVIQIRI